MQIIITGGGGFLGQRLASALVSSKVLFDELILVDILLPANPSQDKRVRCLQVDLSDPKAARDIVNLETGIIFHLAAIVSSHAEKEFDLGWNINLDITRQLLEACRQTKPDIRFVFASSLAVYGGKLPPIVDETTVVAPQSSYGAQKAVCELLVNDYSRKQFVDGCALRLSTVCVRPGRPNLAASSFVSSIIREPLNGESAICPVSRDLTLCVTSPDTVVDNLLLASRLDAEDFGDWRIVNLPGISVTVHEMLYSLSRATNDKTLDLIQFKEDPAINRIVRSWPTTLDNKKAQQLGFKVDKNFDDVIQRYMAFKRGNL